MQFPSLDRKMLCPPDIFGALGRAISTKALRFKYWSRSNTTLAGPLISLWYAIMHPPPYICFLSFLMISYPLIFNVVSLSSSFSSSSSSSDVMSAKSVSTRQTMEGFCSSMIACNDSYLHSSPFMFWYRIVIDLSAFLFLLLLLILLVCECFTSLSFSAIVGLDSGIMPEHSWPDWEFLGSDSLLVSYGTFPLSHLLWYDKICRY